MTAVQPALHFQNGLRHADFLALYAESGFLVEADQPAVSTTGVNAVRVMPMAPRLRRP